MERTHTVGKCDAYKKSIICPVSASPSGVKLRDIRPRFGAVGKQGSIAVVERFIRTIKSEHVDQLRTTMEQMERLIRALVDVKANVLPQKYSQSTAKREDIRVHS